MILLASTTDELRIVTSHAATVDVRIHYADKNGTAVTFDRTNTLISTATTTTVAASPSSGVIRSLKEVTIRNRSALVPCRVTVIHRMAGPVDAEMIGVLLQPGDSLFWHEHDAWRYMRGPFGTLASAHDRVWLDPAVGALYTSVVPRDYVQASATANRLAEVRELQFPVREGQRYWFHYALMYTAAATGTGSRWSVYGPGSPTAVRYISENSLTATTKTTTEGHAAYDLPAASNATSATTGSNVAFIEGFIDTPTCDGIVFLRFASEVSSSAITLKAGSRLEWQRVT